MMGGDTTNSQGGHEASAPVKKRGTTREDSVTRSGQVETLPAGRHWRDKKLRRQRTEVILQPAGEADNRHGSEDGDLAELEATMA
jgi:hypothetical protein